MTLAAFLASPLAATALAIVVGAASGIFATILRILGRMSRVEDAIGALIEAVESISFPQSNPDGLPRRGGPRHPGSNRG